MTARVTSQPVPPVFAVVMLPCPLFCKAERARLMLCDLCRPQQPSTKDTKHGDGGDAQVSAEGREIISYYQQGSRRNERTSGKIIAPRCLDWRRAGWTASDAWATERSDPTKFGAVAAFVDEVRSSGHGACSLQLGLSRTLASHLRPMLLHCRPTLSQCLEVSSAWMTSDRTTARLWPRRWTMACAASWRTPSRTPGPAKTSSRHLPTTRWPKVRCHGLT